MINRLKLFSKIIAVSCDNHIKHNYTVYESECHNYNGVFKCQQISQSSNDDRRELCLGLHTLFIFLSIKHSIKHKNNTFRKFNVSLITQKCEEASAQFGPPNWVRLQVFICRRK
jgi:hypothetical protein